MQEVINHYLDELSVFESQIFTFHQELNNCIFTVNINKMVIQVLQKTTEHYIDCVILLQRLYHVKIKAIYNLDLEAISLTGPKYI